MKTRTTLTKALALFALAFVVLGASAMWYADRSSASAQESSRPGGRSLVINFGPVGVARGQTARVNIFNAGEETGVIAIIRILDADGNMLADSDGPITVAPGHIESLDLFFADGHFMPRTQLRAVVRAVGNPNERCTIHATLEVFDNNTRKTTAFVSPAAVKGCSNNL